MTITLPGSVVETARGRIIDRNWKRRLARSGPGYLFLLPWLIGFFGLTLGPTLVSLYLSFTKFDLFQAPQWVGTANYVRIASNDPNFMASMRVTFLYVAFSVPLKLAFALALATVLNRGIRGLPVYRALFYLPSLLGSSVAIAILWRQLFADNGLVNAVLINFGIQGPSWISSPHYALWTLVVLSVWQFGSPMVIFLAGLQADSDGHLRGGERSTAPPACGSSSRSPCRC